MKTKYVNFNHSAKPLTNKMNKLLVNNIVSLFVKSKDILTFQKKEP